MNVYCDFTSCYNDLVYSVYKDHEFVSNPRGMKIREKLGVSFKLLDPRNRLPYVKSRNFSATYAVAETLWYLLGDNSTEWIANYASFWNKISEDGKARSSYGSRIFRCNDLIANGTFNQWNYVIAELRKDSDSRRAVMHIRVPSDHESKLDVPCTLTLQFFIREGKLHLYVSMRSSDIILGIPYDVFAFTMLQELMAYELGVEVGTYNHTSNSLHVYENHYEMCEKIIEEAMTSCIEPQIPMQPISVWPDAIELDIIQSYARNLKTETELVSLVNHVFTKDMPEFWKDWAYMLIKHRAQKLKLDSVTDACKGFIKFDGYKFFEK